MLIQQANVILAKDSVRSLSTLIDFMFTMFLKNIWIRYDLRFQLVKVKKAKSWRISEHGFELIDVEKAKIGQIWASPLIFVANLCPPPP